MIITCICVCYILCLPKSKTGPYYNLGPKNALVLIFRVELVFINNNTFLYFTYQIKKIHYLLVQEWGFWMLTVIAGARVQVLRHAWQGLEDGNA